MVYYIFLSLVRTAKICIRIFTAVIMSDSLVSVAADEGEPGASGKGLLHAHLFPGCPEVLASALVGWALLLGNTGLCQALLKGKVGESCTGVPVLGRRSPQEGTASKRVLPFKTLTPLAIN